MGQGKRIYYSCAVYHITFRGNNRQRILQEDHDKECLLESISKHKKRFGFKLYGFVLMDNHTHLVLSTSPQYNISKVMHAILLSFSVKFRKHHKYSGYVWEGRFKSRVIETESYILDCLEYIHNNPVRVSLVKRAQDYKWSSYYKYHNSTNSTLERILEMDKYGNTSSVTN